MIPTPSETVADLALRWESVWLGEWQIKPWEYRLMTISEFYRMCYRAEQFENQPRGG